MNNKGIICSAFISQPMNGKTYEEIQDTRQRIIKAMREQHDINIAYITNDFDYTPEYPARTVMLGNSIAKLEESAVIIFTKDAFEAKGCRIEADVCAEYGDEFIDKIYVELDDGTIANMDNEHLEESKYAYILASCKETRDKNNHIKNLESELESANKRIYELQERIHSREGVCNNQYYRLNELENQLTKKSEKIREQSVEIAVLTQSNIHAKSKLIDRIKELEDECDQQAEDNKKLSVELADKKELINKLYKDINRLDDIRETQAKTLRDKDTRIEGLKRMANSVYGLAGGGVVCYDCKRKHLERIKHLESTIERKNKDIDILLEAVKKIEANKYDENDIDSLKSGSSPQTDARFK